MANVDKIAELRGISSIEAIKYWEQVCTASGIKFSTHEVLTALLDLGELAASITPDQLVEKRQAIEAEKRIREEMLKAIEAARLKELAEKRAEKQRVEVKKRKAIEEEIAAKISAEEEEFRQLVTEMSSIGITHSSQVSAYIVRNRLGYKYKHISGILQMEMEGNVWDFNGGFPPKIYARLCKELGLENQGSRAVPREFTPYKDIL